MWSREQGGQKQVSCSLFIFREDWENTAIMMPMVTVAEPLLCMSGYVHRDVDNDSCHP